MASAKKARAVQEIVHAARQVANDHRRGLFPSLALSRLEAWVTELDIAEGCDAVTDHWHRRAASNAP